MGEGAESWRRRNGGEEAAGKRMGEDVGACGRMVPEWEVEAYGRRWKEGEARERRVAEGMEEEEGTMIAEVDEARERRQLGGVGEVALVLLQGFALLWPSRWSLFSPEVSGSLCSGLHCPAAAEPCYVCCSSHWRLSCCH